MAQFAIDELFATGIQISGFIFDYSSRLGTPGQVLTSTSSGVMWQADSSNTDLAALSGQIAATGTLLNNRINSLSGYANNTFLSGNGITNYVPRWNGSKLLITGSIYDNGTNVGIGTISPTTLLSVGGAGSTSAASGITFGGDAVVNLYRLSDSVLKTDAAFTAASLASSSYVYAASYLQTAGGQIYAGAPYGALTVFVGNIAQNAWEAGLFIGRGSYVGIGTTQPTGKLHIVSSVAGETVLRADGTNGILFSVNDDLSDSLMSVNNSAGLPVLEVFADDRVVMGQYGQNDFVLINNKVGIGTASPTTLLSVGGAGSTLAASGLTFGGDAVANLYRISSSRIKTDGSLEVAIGIISPTITSLSGNIAATGSTLDAKINTLSGYSNNSFATILNLAATGSVLDTKINALSGYSNANFATILNLAATGSTLDTKINTTNTNLAATGSTLDTKINTTNTNLAATGSTLNARINSLSGYEIQTFLSGSGTQYYVPRWNTSKELVTGSIYDNGFVGIGITNPSGQLHLRNMGFTSQSGIPDSNIFPNATGVFGLVFDHNTYTNGQYRHRFIKVDRSSNIPLYLQQAGGTANQYINLVRFGAHSQSSDTFEVFGDSKINGTTNITSNLLVSGNAGIGIGNPGYKLDVIGSVRASGELISEGNNSRLSLFRNNGINYFDWASGQSLYFSTQTSVGGGGRSTLMSITSGGNVGIGTVTPNGRLHVVSPDSTYAFSVAGATKGVRFNLNSAGTYIQGVDNTLAGSYQSLILGGSDLYFQTNGLTNAVYIDSSGDVGINTTSPTSKLHVVETTATGTRIQLGTSSESALMNSGSTNDLLILNAPYGVNSATTSNIGAKWGIKFIGAVDSLSNSLGKTSAIYAVSEDTLGYNRGTSLAFYTNQLNDQTYAERMRIYHNGNIGIGTTSPNAKLYVSAGTLGLNQRAMFINADITTNTSVYTHTLNLIDAATDANPTSLALGLYSHVVFRNRPVSAGSVGGILDIYTRGVLTDPTVKMTVTDVGNVGIGTTNPLRKLHITSSDNQLIFISGSTAGTWMDFQSSTSNLWSAGADGTNGFAIFNRTTNSNAVTVANGGNVGIGTTNPTVKLHIINSGTVSSIATVRLVGSTGNNAGSQIEFYKAQTPEASIGLASAVTGGISDDLILLSANPNSIVLSAGASGISVFKADGKVGIGTINPQTLLSLGGLGSTSAASGLTFGGDAQANLYRSAEDTIRTDGSLVVNGNFNTNTTTVTTLNINAGTLPGIPAGSTITGFTYAVNNGNVSQINLVETRFATGGDWTTASTKIQKRTDVTNQAYIEFNPSGASYGMAFGVGFATQTEALRILSNGNIGIGTSVAPLKLNVNGSIYMAAGSGSAISWANDISSQYLKYDSVIDGMILSSWNHTTFHTQQTERVRITSAGNVGINSTAPTAKLSINKGAKDQLLALDIANNDAKYAFYVDQDNNGSNSFSIWDATNSHTAIRYLPSSGGYWQIYTNNVERIRINSDGYVGIATTNPAGKLQVVQGDANARYSTFSSVLGLLIKGNDNSAYNLLTLENTQTGTNYGASINFNLGYGGNSAAAGTAILGARIVAAAEQNFTSTASTQDGYLAFYTTLDGASSEKVRIRSDGTVGIGTVSTIGKLDVYDNTDGPLLSYVRNLNAGSNAYTAFVLRRDGGNNGIVLFTNSSTRSTDGGTGNSTIRTDYGNLLLGAGGSQHILTTAGNVGLGTTNPTQRLEVQGNAQIGNDSVTNVGLNITRLNGGIRTSEHTYHSSQNSPWYTYGQNLNWTNELAGTVESTQAYRPYFEAFAPAVGYKIFGFMNVTAGAFTNTNMVNSLVLKSDGYVGLGTTNPNYQLTVIGANQATADLVDGGNKGGSILVGSSLNNSNQGGAVLFATLNDANTYTPQWAIKSLFLNGQGFGIGDLAFSSRRATGNSNLTESVRFTYDGKVGIGTAIPSSPLHVFNTSATLATFTRDLATDAGFAIGADNNGTVLSTIGVHAIQIYTNNTEKARITSDGKLGIGTNTPTTLLSVGGAGSTTAASGITLGGDASANLYRSSTSQIKTDGSFVAGAYILAGTYLQTSNGNIYPGSFTTDLVLNVGNNAGNNWESYPLTIKKGGYVGIGTNTPSGKLHIVSSVAGETVLRADGTNGTLFSVTDDLSDSLMSVNNSAGLPVLEVFADDRIVAGQYGSGDFVLVNNKVGIGTSNPSYKLDVNGSLGINASTSDTNWPFVVSDNSSAGSRYGLNKAGSMGFNNADNYAQLQLLGTNGAYIDFTNSVGGDSNARLIYYASNRLDLTYGFIPKGTISLTSNAIGIGTTSPAWALDVSGTAIRSFASGAIEPGFIVDYASSNGYGGLFIHTNGVRKWRIGNVGDTDATSPALYIWQEGVGARMYFRNNGNVGIATTIPIYTLDVSGTIRGERYRGINSLVLNTYTTVNPASNVFLYSQANDRDSWIYLDSADTSSNWGIYHRQIDSAVSNLPANSIGFIGGGTSTLQSYISLTNGSAYFAGSVGIGTVSPTTLLSVGGPGSTSAASGLTFGGDAQANLYRSAEDTIKTDGNLVVAGTTSLNGHIYGQKTVTLSTASWTTVLTVNMLAHNSCYVKIGAFGDWSNHSAVAFVSELFIQNGDNAGYGEPGTIITAHDNTRGPAGDKIDIQIVDPAAAGTQNFLIQLKLISATSSTNSSLITYHVMGQQASVT